MGDLTKDLSTSDGTGGTTQAPLPTFHEQLPDDLKGHELLKGKETMGDVARAYIDTVKSLEGRIKVPGPDSSDEEKIAFRTARGVPETPDKYELQMPMLPDGMKVSEDMVKWFKGLAHQSELTNSAANVVLRAYVQRMIQQHYSNQDTLKKARDEATAKQKETWGDNYNQKHDAAMRAVRQFGGEGFESFLAESTYGNDPRMIEFCANIGELLQEDGSIKGGKPAIKEGKPGREGEIDYSKTAPELYETT